ncbi:MAG: ATP-binding cassette domain-containing protein [Azospirillaceae bacterium]
MSEPLLIVRDLTREFGRGARRVRALAGVSLTLDRGQTLGVVGESGSGKTTLGRAILRLIEPTSGTVRLAGEDLLALSPGTLKRARRRAQIVFQDPFGSLNPRHTVRHIVGEPLIVHRVGTPAQRRARVDELLAAVGLGPEAGDRFPHEFSGGQRQRIAIARAIALDPDLVIADEPVSALDVSIQSQVLNLIADLRRDRGIAFLYISHDLSVVRHVSDRVAVMYFGRVVEIDETDRLYARPAHPYTRALLSAVPRLQGEAGRGERITLEGELPDPSNPPPGCPFAQRCVSVHGRCRQELPGLVPRTLTDGSRRPVACHLFPTAG